MISRSHQQRPTHKARRRHRGLPQTGHESTLSSAVKLVKGNMFRCLSKVRPGLAGVGGRVAPRSTAPKSVVVHQSTFPVRGVVGRPLTKVAAPLPAGASCTKMLRLPGVVAGVPFRALSSVAPGGSPAAAPAAPAAAPAPFDPNATMAALKQAGLVARDKSSAQLFASSFLGGAMLSWGSILMMVVAGGAPSLAGDPGLLALLRGAVFPLGLSLIVLSKSELVTANFLTQSLPDSTTPDAARVLAVSFAANLTGSLAMVGAAAGAGLFAPGAAKLLVGAATGKAALAPSVAFLKGVGANWLVNLAVYQAAASPRAGKGCEIPNFKGSYLGRFPLVLADFWTSDHLSERSPP